MRADIEADHVKSLLRRLRRWISADVPDTSNVVRLLQSQAEVSLEAIEAFTRWAEGEPSARGEVRRLEHVADSARRQVLEAIRSSFITPVEPEDLFELSERLDAVVNQAKDLVQEAEVLSVVPNEPMAAMSEYVLDGVRELASAVSLLTVNPKEATAAADRATRDQRRIEHEYRQAMSSLLCADAREIAALREIYRRYARIGEGIEHVANRVWYAVVKRG